MTDHKFTDEEVIKALECCITSKSVKDCKDLKCPACYKNGCVYFDCADVDDEYGVYNELIKDALALINRQKAEIETWKDIAKRETGYVKIARAEAIKEFAKKIKTDAERICDDNYIEGALIKYVDTLVKEMTEGKNESQSTKTVGGVIPARSGEA